MQDKGAAPELGCREWGSQGSLAARVSLVKGGRSALWLCPRAVLLTPMGWICPIPQPTMCCGTRDMRFPPRSNDQGEPLAGLCTPRDLGEGRDCPHHITRHSRGTATRAAPRNAIEPFPGLFPSTRLRGEVSGNSSPGPSAGTPQDNSPTSDSPNPNSHPIFPPNKPKPAALQTGRDSSSRIWLPGSFPATQSGFH